MGWSYGVRLPLRKSNADGYMMLKSLKSTIKQNLKMLVLTNPGERVMDPEFGVGIMSYLFENYGTDTYQDVATKIRTQVKRYMPIVQILKIDFNASDPDSNKLGIRIVYRVPQIALQDFLVVTI